MKSRQGGKEELLCREGAKKARGWLGKSLECSLELISKDSQEEKLRKKSEGFGGCLMEQGRGAGWSEVLTIPGIVLFRTGQWELRSSAESEGGGRG